MFEISLTQQECLSCEAAAKRAINLTNAIGARDFTVGDRLRNHRMGAGGEIAMCRLLGIKWDEWAIDGQFGRRNFGDVLNIEVRATAYEPPWLKLNDRDKPKLNRAFALLHCSSDFVKYKLVGWVKGTLVIDRCEIKDFGNGEKSYIVPTSLLREPYDLLERFAIWAENKNLSDYLYAR